MAIVYSSGTAGWAISVFESLEAIAKRMGMRLANYSQARLVSDNHRVDSSCHGDIGDIIEVYPDGYEVEFSRDDGSTKALIVACPAEVLLAEEP